MERQNDRATALNTNNINWNEVANHLKANADFRNDMDTLRSPKRFKRAVKEMVASMTISERIADYALYLDVANEFANKTLGEIQDSLVGVNLDMVHEPEPLDKDATDDEVMQHKTDWALYSLVGKVELFENRIEVLNILNQGGKKLLSKILNAMVTVRARSIRNQVIVNAVVKSVSRHFDGDLNKAIVAIEIIAGAGFVKIHKAKTQDNRTEFVYEFKEDFKELRNIYHITSDRAAKVTEPDHVTKDIVGKDKFAYEQPVEPMADVIDYLSQTPVSFKSYVGEEEVMSLIDLEIIDEDGNALYDEDWKYRIRENYLRSFNIIQEAGNVFYIPRKTDGVGRIYGVGEYGLHNHHAHLELTEFADKEVLNEDGKWAMRQYIVELAGYRPDGRKPTEEEAEAFFFNVILDSNYDANAKVQEAVNIYFSDEPTGLGIEIDAQTQGPGLYGLLTGDENLCFNTAIIGNTIRTDMYQLLANGINSRLSVVAWNRTNCKSALMTKGYGAGYKTIMFGSGKDADYDFDSGVYTIHSGSKKAVPLMETAETVGITSTKDVWSSFDKTMKAIAPKMLETQALISYIQGQLGEAVLTWTMPDGVQATVATQDTKEIHVKWVDQYGRSHSMLHHVRVLDSNNTTALAPRLVQSVDAFVLRQVVRKCIDAGIGIMVNHDGFVFHPNHVRTGMRFYREVLAEVFDMDLLTDILGQLVGRKLTTSYRTGTVTKEDILDSKYSIWF